MCKIGGSGVVATKNGSSKSIIAPIGPLCNFIKCLKGCTIIFIIIAFKDILIKILKKDKEEGGKSKPVFS